MNSILVAVFALFASSFRTRAALQAEVLALRHQLAVLQANAPRRLRLRRSDRLLWILFVSPLVGLASMSADCSTGHGDRLAPQSIRLALDSEVTAPAGKTTRNG